MTHDEKIKARLSRAMRRSIKGISPCPVNSAETRKEIAMRVSRVFAHAVKIGWIEAPLEIANEFLNQRDKYEF